MGQLTIVVPPPHPPTPGERRAKSYPAPNLSSWHLCDKMWGKLGTHLTPWRVLNVTPCLASTPFCPGVQHWEVKCNLSCTGDADIFLLSRKEKTLYSAHKPSGRQLLFTQFFFSYTGLYSKTRALKYSSRPPFSNLTSVFIEAFLVSMSPSIFVSVHIPPVFPPSPRRQ